MLWFIMSLVCYGSLLTGVAYAIYMFYEYDQEENQNERR